jgi:predicted permease
VLLGIIVSGTRMLGVPPRLDLVIDAQVLAFTTAVMMLAAVLFGLLQASMVFAPAPAKTLRDGSGAGQRRSRRRVGNVLVAAQVALSLVLLTVAGVFAAHLLALRDRNELGFDPASVLLVSVEPPRGGERRPDLPERFAELLRRFASVPGVSAVTLSAMTPISGAAGSRFVTVEGFQESADARRRVQLNAVAPGYFATMRTPLVAGRDVGFDDVGRQRVAIVNEAVVRYYFDGRDPLGARIRFDTDSEPHEIVGVVADAKYSDVRVPAPRTIYLHAFQQSRVPSEFMLRTQGSPTSVAGDVRRIVDETVAGATIAKMTTLREQVDASIVPERLIAAMSGFFGGTGLLLAVVGLFGLLAYTVARSTREIGVRMALGAEASGVMLIVLRSALWLVGAGVIAGVPLAMWSTRIAASALGTLAVRVLPVLAGAGLLLVAVGMLAAYVPARRATRVDPLAALRSE